MLRNRRERQNLTFFQRVILPDAPQDKWEGIGKGLYLGATVTSFLLLMNIIEFEPAIAKKVLMFYAGMVLIFAGWGTLNEVNREPIQISPG